MADFEGLGECFRGREDRVLRAPGVIRTRRSIANGGTAAMRHEDIWDKEAADSYDTPGTGMFAPSLLGPTVERLARLAAGGRALELAIGTGRVAIPLSERGVPVSGIEIAPAMVERLREKVDAATIPVVIGDMTTATVPGEFSLAFLVFNGISNVLTQAEQIACFHNAARHLTPGGRFVIELGPRTSQGASRGAGDRRRCGARLLHCRYL